MAEVTLLNVHHDETTGPELPEDINLNRRGVLIATATAGGTYDGDNASSSVGVAIYLRAHQSPDTPWNDTQIVAHDSSGEAQASRVTYRCSATALQVLNPGRYNLKAVRRDTRVNRNTSLTLDLVVLSAAS
jgi:hypothetical protein